MMRWIAWYLFIRNILMVSAALGIKPNHVGHPKGNHVTQSSVPQILKKLTHIETELQNQRLFSKRQHDLILEQNKKIRSLEHIVQGFTVQKQSTPDTHYEGSNYGCSGEAIDLSCSGNKTIHVLAAEYGEYWSDDYCAEDECCIPHPNDCTEQVINNNAADWVVLKLECDNKTECSYLFQASTFIENCTVSAIVDYMTVFYTCLPADDTDQPVAFTAYTDRSREFLDGDVINFEKTITNLGNYYHSNSSVFICPSNGLYQFSIYVMGNINSSVHANIMVEGRQMVIAWADGLTDAFNHASNSVLVECKAGEKVWVQSSSSLPGSMVSNAWKHSTFSGLLIKRFDE